MSEKKAVKAGADVGPDPESKTEIGGTNKVEARAEVEAETSTPPEVETGRDHGAESSTHAGADEAFRPLDADNPAATATRDFGAVADIPVTLSVELGRTRLTIRQLLDLAQGSLVQLGSVPGEPLDIRVNEHLIAQGEIVVADGKFGIRVTEVVRPADRLQRTDH